MLDNITIGKYVDNETFFHKINPISKILMTLIFSIFTIIQDNIYITYSITILTILLIILSKSSIKNIIKILKSFWFLLTILLIINILNGFSLEKYTIYVLKLLLVMVDANILTTTTSLTDLNYGIYTLLKPLNFLHKSLANKVTLMITLAIRFIPTLLDEANRQLKALKSRGINIKKASYKNKIKILCGFITTLVYNTIDKADEIAENMELREYDIDEYTVYTKNKDFHFIDYFFIGSYTTILICVIIRGVLLWDI